MAKYRYTIILDREDGEDWGPEQAGRGGDTEGAGFHDGSDEAAISQVAREFQEAMNQSGLPAGFFDVIKREKLPLGTPYPNGNKAL
jgi:hypothetical protein